MTLSEIRKMPQTTSTRDLHGAEAMAVHESVFRSYHVIQKVRKWLQCDPPVPPVALLEVIDYLMERPDDDGN